MRCFSALVVVALVPYIAGAAESTTAAKKDKNFVQGYVVSVQKDGDKVGSITVRLKAKKKAASTAAPVEKTYKVTANTKFTVISGKKGAVQQAEGDFSKVQAGGRVVLVHNGSEATDVKVLKKGKGKKKKNA